MTNELTETELTDLGKEIDQTHIDFLECCGAAIMHARSAGCLAIKAKAAIPHGSLETWVTNHCRVEVRQVQRYMRLAERWDDYERMRPSGTHLSLGEAMKLLSNLDPDPWRKVSHPIEPDDPLPPERKVVAVWCAGRETGSAALPYVGYVRYASGELDSPYFVVYHGNSDRPVDVIAWCDCVPEVGPSWENTKFYDGQGMGREPSGDDPDDEATEGSEAAESERGVIDEMLWECAALWSDAVGATGLSDVAIGDMVTARLAKWIETGN